MSHIILTKKREKVNQLFMYDISGSMPVYYRRMPGNIPDTRTLRTTLKELDLAGFKGAQRVLDRGYLSAETIELLVKRRISFIMMAKTNSKDIRTTILFLDADRLCLPEEQGADRKELAQHIHEMSGSLDAIIEEQIALDDRTVKRLGEFLSLTLDEKQHTLLSYTTKEQAMHSYWALSGFFVIICSRVKHQEYPLSYVLDRYRMRDEQEKCFMFIKSEQNGKRLRTSTEPSTDGRMLIQFIALTLNAVIHRVYKSNTKLTKRFPTRAHMIEEMRSIRRIEHPKRAKIIPEFGGAQVDIFDAFDFAIPSGCRPSSRPKRKN